MTPLQISIALHYHCCSGDFEPERWDAPAVQSAINDFIEIGMLRISQEEGQRYKGVAEPLRIYVEALGRVKPPELKWVMP